MLSKSVFLFSFGAICWALVQQIASNENHLVLLIAPNAYNLILSYFFVHKKETFCPQNQTKN